jgi:hypothetical protein
MLGLRAAWRVEAWRSSKIAAEALDLDLNLAVAVAVVLRPAALAPPTGV